MKQLYWNLIGFVSCFLIAIIYLWGISIKGRSVGA